MKCKSLILLVLVTAFSLQGLPIKSHAATVNSPFVDVPNNSYGENSYIRKLVERNVVSGYGDQTFRMYNEVTRGEFATFIARALDLPKAASSFTDLGKSSAVYDGVSKAYAAGIIKGFGDGTIQPYAPVLREEMAVMVDRALQMNGTFTAENSLDFADRSLIGAYAKTAVARAYWYDTMDYYKGGLFAPKKTGSRIATAKAISEMLDMIEGKKTTYRFSYTKDYGLPIIKEVHLNLKGFIFIKGYDGAWYNEFGAKLLDGLPKPLAYNSLEKRDPINVNYNQFTNEVEESAAFAIINYNMNVTRQQFVNAVNEVRQTKKTVNVNGYRFYIKPNGKHPLDILYRKVK